MNHYVQDDREKLTLLKMILANGLSEQYANELLTLSGDQMMVLNRPSIDDVDGLIPSSLVIHVVSIVDGNDGAYAYLIPLNYGGAIRGSTRGSYPNTSEATAHAMLAAIQAIFDLGVVQEVTFSLDDPKLTYALELNEWDSESLQAMGEKVYMRLWKANLVATYRHDEVQPALIQRMCAAAMFGEGVTQAVIPTPLHRVMESQASENFVVAKIRELDRSYTSKTSGGPKGILYVDLECEDDRCGAMFGDERFPATFYYGSRGQKPRMILGLAYQALGQMLRCRDYLPAYDQVIVRSTSQFAVNCLSGKWPSRNIDIDGNGSAARSFADDCPLPVTYELVGPCSLSHVIPDDQTIEKHHS